MYSQKQERPVLYCYKGHISDRFSLSIRSDKKSKSLGLGQGIIYWNNACCICKGNQVFGCLGYSEELWCIMDSILMEFLMDFILMFQKHHCNMLNSMNIMHPRPSSQLSTTPCNVKIICSYQGTLFTTSRSL